jgi:hypothetical protein
MPSMDVSRVVAARLIRSGNWQSRQSADEGEVRSCTLASPVSGAPRRHPESPCLPAHREPGEYTRSENRCRLGPGCQSIHVNNLPPAHVSKPFAICDGDKLLSALAYALPNQACATEWSLSVWKLSMIIMGFAIAYGT